MTTFRGSEYFEMKLYNDKRFFQPLQKFIERQGGIQANNPFYLLKVDFNVLTASKCLAV